MYIFMEFNNGKNFKYLKNLICEHNHYRKNIDLIDNTYSKRDRFSDDKIFISKFVDRKLTY